MKRFVLFVITIFIALIVLVESGVINSLIAFLLVGVVPGTDIVINPNTMLLIIAAAAWLFLVHTTILGMVNIRTLRKLVNKHTERQAHLPKRRFSQI